MKYKHEIIIIINKNQVKILSRKNIIDKIKDIIEGING